MQILLVGCGRMGDALRRGWAQDVTVQIVEPRPPAGVVALVSPADLPVDYHPDLVVFAVKPQQMDAVLPAYAGFVQPNATFLSIAAGKTLSRLKALLGEEAAIVRAMPNTPAAIGRGISVAVANAQVTPEGRRQADQALRAGGLVAWVEDETLMDAVTALSGSGPAYVFLLTECLAEAGRRLGLTPDLADTLARATVAGSGALLGQTTDPPASLRQAVTSPGGTTQAALSVLMETSRLQDLLVEALRAAHARSRELGQV